MDEDEFWALIEQYDEKFGEGPPIFDMDHEEACHKMREAIKSGRAITDTPDKHLPDGAIM